MKNTGLLIILYFLIVGNVLAQTPRKYWIHFKDKNNSPYTITDPTPYLSAKAISRRQNQNIAINSSDLPVNPAYVTDVLAVGNVILINKSKWLNGIVIQTDDTNKVNQIKQLACVSSSRLVFRVAPSIKGSKFIESDNIANRMSGVTAITDLNYGGAYNQIHMMNGDYLHNKGYKGEGMTIAVLDAGFPSVNTLPAFDSLRQNNQILGGYDFVTNTPNIYANDNHGTMVLSCMAAYLDNRIIGTSPKASFWLLRSEYAPTENIIEEYNWASAAEFADSVGVDIITSSLGYTTFDNSTQNHTYKDMNGNTAPCTIAADIAASKGILVLNSAGNEGASSWHYVGAPADADSIISVGAVKSDGTYATFSSRGPTYDDRIKPTVSVQGAATTIATPAGAVTTGNGTSFSCPVLTGAVACLWQAHPDATNMEVIDAVKRSSSQYVIPDSYLGYGIPNMMSADILLTSIHELKQQKSQLKIFPNPYSSELNVLFYSSTSQQVSIELYNTVSKLIYSASQKTTALSVNYLDIDVLPFLNAGIYYVKVKTATDSFTEKIVKQ